MAEKRFILVLTPNSHQERFNINEGLMNDILNAPTPLVKLDTSEGTMVFNKLHIIAILPRKN